MVDNNKHISLNDDSLVMLLNMIMAMIKQDRANALKHHDELSEMLHTANGMSDTEIQLLLNELSTALNGFLKNSAQSADQAIKVANILANRLSKVETGANLTDDDRESIQSLVEQAKGFGDLTGFESIEERE